MVCAFLEMFLPYLLSKDSLIPASHKISGLRMFYNTPLFQPCQNPQPYPLYNLDNYCKIFVIGGLAQLVEQRTLKSVRFHEISPSVTQSVAEIEVFSLLKSDNTPQHTTHKKSHSLLWLFNY